jgi:hypothetical protein
MKQFLILAILLLSIAGTVTAGRPDSTGTKLRLVPLPVLAYTPETDLIIGATALGQFRLRGVGSSTRTSSIIAAVNYTLNDQYMLQFVQSVFFPDERYIWTGEIVLGRLPQNFWGIGRNTPKDAEVLFDQKQILIVQSIYTKVGPSVFTGPRFRYVRLFDVSFKSPDGVPVTFPSLTGEGGHTGLAFGWGIQYDRRNRLLTPTRGSFMEMNTVYQHKNVGSTYTFGKIELDARNYFDLRGDENSVLAVQIRSVHAFGDVPFDLMPFLGGAGIMRGIYQGRYRDKNSTAGQVEFRQHIFWRIGAVAFFSAGTIGASAAQAFDSAWRYAGGGGIRFNIGRYEMTNIRFDFGFGPNMSGAYITFGEAF